VLPELREHLDHHVAICHECKIAAFHSTVQ
jgi:hypothetical protein